jgi:hypothetical protein
MEKKNYQIYGIDKNGSLTHAGTHEVENMDVKTAKKFEREWKQWRKQYLKDNPGDYPLRHTLKTVKYHVHPIGKPEECTAINL